MDGRIQVHGPKLAKAFAVDYPGYEVSSQFLEEAFRYETLHISVAILRPCNATVTASLRFLILRGRLLRVSHYCRITTASAPSRYARAP